MRLSDIMSYADLANYAEIALVIFLGIYALVAITTLVRRDRRAMDDAAAMPLHDGTTTEAPSADPER
ncbi:MAG: hypothetical protein H6678_07270 [Candidatus Delongbacteria bacterium]|nr:hypothetical protein [Candidatus Cloacimonadota bacterium]MCA9786730.1 hypothetical protein [Candidatus Cloacimonadota bacterium]MCB9473593.1 hypothetical protein [Candidatus Delongbacteria bacterium]